VIEIDNGVLPLAALRDDRALGATVVRVIPREHRFVASRDTKVAQVRDLAGILEDVFTGNQVRGAVVRPDRYVAACLAWTSDADEADRLLRAIIELSNLDSRGVESATPFDLTIA
jgi:hypothetical protein